MMPNIGQRLLRAFGNLAKQEALETGQLDGLSLLLIQSCQALLNDSSPFLKRQPSPGKIHAVRFHNVELGGLMPVVEIPQREVLATAETPVVGILEYPRFRAALGRIELASLVVNFQKDFLHHIFGFTSIAQNSQSDLQDKPVEPVKQNRQRVRIALLELFHHVFVSHVRFEHKWNAEGGSRRIWNNGLVMQRFNPSSEADSRSALFLGQLLANGMSAGLQ